MTEDIDTITSIPTTTAPTTAVGRSISAAATTTTTTTATATHTTGIATLTSVSTAPSVTTSSGSSATFTTNATEHPHPNRNRRPHQQHLPPPSPPPPPPRRGRSHSMAVSSRSRSHTGTTTTTTTTASSSVSTVTNHTHTKHSTGTSSTNTPTSITTTGRAWNHHRRRTNKDEVDRLGERILELLLRRCDSRRKSRHCRSRSTSPYDNNNSSDIMHLHFQWKKPILCHHNWMVLQRHWIRMTQPQRSLLSSSLLISSLRISSTPKHIHRTIAATTMTRHAMVFGSLSLCVTTTMTAVLGTGVILLTTWLFLVLLLTSLDVLLDLQNNAFLQQSFQRLQSFYTFVDRHLFQGRRYSGRTIWYTTNTHHKNTTSTPYEKYLLGPYDRYTQQRPNHNDTTTTMNNIFTPLHQLNIPASLSNTAKTTTNQRQNLPWSYSTTKHLQAMRYCYIVQKQYRIATTTLTHHKKNTNRTVQIIHSDHNATEVLERDNSTSVSREEDNEDTGRNHPLPSGTDTVRIRHEDEEEEGATGSTDPLVESTTTHADLAWIDVGAQIGLRLLHSEHVQRAMALQDTKERILETMNANHNHMVSGGSVGTTAHTTTNGMNVNTTTLSPRRNRKSDMQHSNPTSAHPVTTLPTSNSMDASMMTTSPTTTTTAAVNRGTSNSSKIPPKPIHTMWTSPGSAAITNHHRDHQNSRDRHPPPALAPYSPIDPNENEPSASLHHLHDNHHYDDNSNHFPADHVDNDNFPILRQSQSYPISPCSSPRALLTLSSIQLPPLQSPSATTAMTNNNTSKEQSNTDALTTTIHRDAISHTNLPDLPLTPLNNTRSAQSETVETSIHAPSVYSNNVTSNEITRSQPRRVLSSQTNHGTEKNTSSVGRSFKQQGRVHCHRRVPLLAGMKVAVPMTPYQPHHKVNSATAMKLSSSKISYMMSTVVRSQRIYVDTTNRHTDHQGGAISVFEHDSTNCLSVTVKLDKFFLRHGEFGEMTFRVLDEWSTRYMPRHSKVPIGACVATSFGIGVLVGWRVEDDSHIVRSLWQCRGSGSAYAYMNRNSIHKAVVAANGFRVQTVYGWGIVQACVKGGTTFTSCRYFVVIREEKSRHKGNVLELDATMILSCHGAQFMPVIEHVRAAALYQIQMDNYNASLREQQLLRGENAAEKEEQEFLRNWSVCADILWNSFLKAVEEDEDFDEGVHDFVQSMIDFLDRLDKNDDPSNVETQNESTQSIRSKLTQQLAVKDVTSDEIEIEFHSTGTNSSLGQHSNATHEPGFWFMNDLFGGIFKASNHTDTNPANDAVSEVAVNDSDDHSNIDEHKMEYNDNDIPVIKKKKSYFKRAFAVLRTIMKTVSIAQASSVDHPHFRLALAISYDVLLFLRTILKIQQRNTSVESLKVWKRAWGEIIATFGPIQERLESIGQGIANRMEHQGRKAKVRVLKFVDTILGDERLLFAMEQGEWDRCLARIEIALVEAEVIEEKNLIYYRKAATFIYDHVQMLLRNNEGAAARNNEKLAILGHLIQAMAAPRRSILKIFCREDMLELFERILVRAYYKEEVATRMLTIHAATFHTLRHLRILKDFSVSGRMWIPLLDAADEELSCFVSNLPDNSQGIMLPVSRLFSLCVAQFHKINDGDLSKDWLAFLLEEESVQIIQEIDMLLILGLESFSRDIREMMTVLPYYASIDDDILNLMDEVNLDEFLKEAASAIDNPDKLAEYIREKATIAIERFLNYLPKMSIPVEKRELGDGWVLSCHGSDGGGLTLTDVTIRRENLVCQIMGGDTLFFPMFNDNNENLYHDSNTESFPVPTESLSSGNVNTPCDIAEEESILDHIRILLLNAQKYGCWKVGFGGICQTPSDPYAASILRDIPISNVLNCSIELWRNLQIDDDALLEIAIRDISYHIQLQKRQEEAEETNAESETNEFHHAIHPSLSESTSTTQVQHHNTSRYNNYSHSAIPQRLSSSSSFDGPTATSSQNQHQHRFNPRVDPTVLFLEIKRLTLNLDNFFFRIEKAADKKTIFDPVFAGRGMLSLQNISIRLRVECAKERVKQPAGGGVGGQHSVDIVTPILQLRQLEVSLEKLSMTVKDTGFGSDWILNKAVEVFEEKLTEVVVTNLKDQIQEQLVHNILESLNSYFLINPNLLLNVLGISMDDLDENVVWV